MLHSQKPRLRKQRMMNGRFVWVCEGRGIWCFEETPRKAYECWWRGWLEKLHAGDGWLDD